MALLYYLYQNNSGNTVIDRGETSFAPLPPNTGEIQYEILIPETQPLYYYRESGGTIISNDDTYIKLYKQIIYPPTQDDYVPFEIYTGYTNTNNTKITNIETAIISVDNNVTFVSGATSGNTVAINQLSSDYSIFSGQTNQYFDYIYSGITKLRNSIAAYFNQVPIAKYSGSSIQENTIGEIIVSGFTTLSAQTETKLSINDFDSYSALTTTQIDDKIPIVSGATAGNLAFFTSGGTLVDSGISIDSLTGGTGYYFYVDREVNQTNATATPASYLTFTADTAAGTWSIDFNVVGGGLNANKGIEVYFYIDAVLQGVVQRFITNNSAAQVSFVLTKDLALTAANHTFLIEFNNYNGGTAFVDYASIRGRIVK